MKSTSRVAAQILPGAVFLGALGDVLLRQGPWGINFGIWIAALAGGIFWASRLPGAAASHRRLLLLPIGFALCFAWRDAPFLTALNFLAALTALGLIGLKGMGVRVRAARWTEYVRGTLGAVFNATLGPLLLLSADLEWEQVTGKSAGRKAGSALLGVALATPLVLIFGGLLTAADPIFDSFVRASFDWDFGKLTSHLFVIGFVGWLVAGYLRGLVFGMPTSIPHQKIRPSFGMLEIGIPLAALSLIFLSFSVVQARYLFGGAELVQNVSGLTYAEYARRGFFELVTASALVLPVLLVADLMLDKSDHKRLRRFRILSSVLLILVAMVMDSALTRMLLYVETYGLTTDRFYATTFMIWIGLVLIWFATTTLFGDGRRFALGAVASGLAIAAILNVANPDVVISRVNLHRARHGSSLDVAHLGRLSADATPFLLSHLESLGKAETCELLAHVDEGRTRRGNGWRTWNLSRQRAERAKNAPSALAAFRLCRANVVADR